MFCLVDTTQINIFEFGIVMFVKLFLQQIFQTIEALNANPKLDIH